MPVRGQMRFADQEKVRSNLTILKQNMDAKDLLHRMQQDKIFSIEDREYIVKSTHITKQNRNDAFFELLFQRGPDAYDSFLCALREGNKYTHLADALESTGSKCVSENIPDPMPSVQRGRMNKDDEEKITDMFVTINEQLDAKYLVDKLYSDGIISENDRELILNHKRDTRENRNEAFFEIIFQRGKGAYGAFLLALRVCGYPDLADKIARKGEKHDFPAPTTETRPVPGTSALSTSAYGGRPASVDHVASGMANVSLNDNTQRPQEKDSTQTVSTSSNETRSEQDENGVDETDTAPSDHEVHTSHPGSASVELECAVCKDKSSKFVLVLPCKHAKTCQKCIETIMKQAGNNHVCPVCRKQIVEYEDIFI